MLGPVCFLGHKPDFPETKGAMVQKRYLPVAVLTVVLAVVAALGYSLPRPSEDQPRRVLLPNAGGAVIFEHAAHVSACNIPCQTCHHESPALRKDVQQCGKCHGAVFDAAFRKSHVAAFADNASCATCHHFEGGPKKWGHDKHHAELGLECTECHHSDTSIEDKPQNCARCHKSGAPSGKKTEKGVAPNLADAVHARCVSCHEDMFAAGARGCASCHTVRPVREKLPQQGIVTLNPLYVDCAVCHAEKAQKLVPGRMDAFHRQCMGCHEKTGKGPYGKQSCARCHTGK